MSKTKKLIFYGNETSSSDATDAVIQNFLDVTASSSFEIISQRSEAYQKSVTVSDDDIIEMEFDNGFVRMVTLDQLQKEFPKDSYNRSAYTLAANELELPLFIEGEEHSRGFIKNLLKRCRIFSVDDKLAEMAAVKIARKVEDKLEPSEGLYRCPDPNQLGGQAENLATDQSILLLIHGTASSTKGSFGGFATEGIPSSAWARLQNTYKENIVAFEHKTLSKSPLQNALHLLKLLPEEANLHLLTHSRGGLIGEILCRGAIDNQEAFTENDIRVLQEEDRKEDAAIAVKINTLLKSKKIKVTRFVRVACPVSGTTLASKRLDHYFTVMLNLIGLIPALRLSPIYGYVKSFLIAFVKKKADIKILPGLESMIPDSPLIKILNNPTINISSELFIISGDVKAHGIGHSIAVMLSDVFYRSQHDFVVNTSSMFGGSRRNRMLYTFYNNKDISHFNYFVNKSSQDHIANALVNDQKSLIGFKSLDEQLLEDFEVGKVRGMLNYVNPSEALEKNKPLVYVIPGIMGSKLRSNGDRIWVNPFRLALGGMGKLRMNSPEVEAFQLMGSAYKSIIKALRKDYNVIPFPYDWRTSIVQAANYLASDIKERLKYTDQPIRLMAHSMGGLVVHAFYSMPEHKDTWNQLMSRSGSRVIFLGSPLKGSHVIPSVFMKKDKFFKILHRIDLTNNATKILEIIKDYQGLLELLPSDAEHNYFQDAIWDKLHSREENFVKPLRNALKKAEELQKLFKENPIKGENIVYVAGKDRYTPCQLRFEGQHAKLMATSEGDGRVTWETGIPSQLMDKTWYMDAIHGDLCSSKRDFPALFDLLETGFTQRLANKPIIHRGEKRLFEMPEELPLAIHTEVALEHEIMGLDPMMKLEDPEVYIKVEVCHGDLGNATYPIVVGHHLGDPIVSAEGAVDHYMQNRLSKNKSVGVYPGALETSLVLFNEESYFKGAIVVGLGIYGELNEGKLTRSISHALLDYAITCAQKKSKNNIDQQTATVGISTLLIASDYSGLSIKNSIRSILNGILQANKIIQAKNDSDIPIIGDVEFVEVYKDRAIHATRELLKVMKEPLFSEKIIFDNPIVKEVSGRRRRVPGEKSSDWWHRLKIEGKGESDYPPLRFVSLTDRARAEEEIKATQRSLIDNLIESSVQGYEWNEQNAKTLFHLLIPNDFKDYTTDNKNILLILDEKSAAYPWEILHLPNVKYNTPLVTQIGLIRQLITPDYDQVVNSTLENSALIVGNPKTSSEEKYPSLPHAADEANTVADIFKNKAFDTTVSIEEPGVSVVNKLFGNNYKIIHLAGHGIIEENEVSRTGMVLDKDMFITASEIDALPKTPELVFINCCYLGKKVEENTKFHKLAANVGTQFIRKGVKAVVAAGWAINDAAAKHFAEVLYARLFDGETFGEAVRQARLSTYQNYSSSNTWGAYQCYGDPFYKLVNNSRSHIGSEIIYVDPLEVIVDLENISSQAEPASSRDRVNLKNKLQNTVKQIPSQWLDDSKVVEAIADCYYELNDYDQAISYYKKLNHFIDGQNTLEGMLRLANIQAKVAVKKLSVTGINQTDDKKARESVEQAEEIIENILKFGENSRRYAIKGGHYKRKSLLKNDHLPIDEQFDFIKECLEISLQSYQTAHHFITDQQGDYYTIINWATLEVIYQFYGGRRKVAMENAKEKIEWLRSNFKKHTTEEKSFWYYIFPAALGIFDLLIENEEKNRVEIKKDVIEIYKTNWMKGGSIRKSENTMGQVDFLIEILEKRRSFKITRSNDLKIVRLIADFKELKQELILIFNKNK